MPLHTIIFAVSLLLLALFFALKEREVYAGEHTAVTRVLHRYSPHAEGWWMRFRTWVMHRGATVFAHVASFARTAWSRISVTFRYLVVLCADKMIRAVKGEKLLEMRGGAPSMYLKHLKEARDTKK